MRKLVVAMIVLAALGFAAPPAQAGPVLSWVELGFKSSIDHKVYDNPYDPDGNGWPPAGAVFSAGFLDPNNGLGTVTYTFNTAGSHYVAGFFDYQFVNDDENNGFFDEWGDGYVMSAFGASGTIDDSFSGTAFSQFQAFDATHPFDNLGHLIGPPDGLGDVAMGLGYKFSLNSGDHGRKVIFEVSRSEVGGLTELYQVDDPSGERVYFSLRTEDTADIIPGGRVPDAGSTLTLLGLGLAALARKLRRRP